MCACLICLSCLKTSYWYGNILHFSREEDSCVWRQLCMPHSPFVPLLSRSSFICFPLILLLYIPLVLLFLHFLLFALLLQSSYFSSYLYSCSSFYTYLSFSS